MRRVISSICCASLLMGATLLTPVSGALAEEEGGTWLQGGQATNQPSKKAAEIQKQYTRIAQTAGIIFNTIALITPYWAINVDFFGITLDAMLLHDAKHRKAKWGEEIPPELQAAIRQIGDRSDLEGECEGDAEGTCNEVNATLDETEVHVLTLKNVGLEALEDVSGSLLITPEQLISAAPVIQEGFGTKTQNDLNASVKKNPSSGVIYWNDYVSDPGQEETKKGTRQAAGGQTVAVTEEERKNWGQRKLAHLQLSGTAGVARADMGATVAASERANFERLSSYVGSGAGVIANIKVLCGLDLTLAQRLNMLNMLYGQQAVNEAASALQLVDPDEDKSDEDSEDDKNDDDDKDDDNSDNK